MEDMKPTVGEDAQDVLEIMFDSTKAAEGDADIIHDAVNVRTAPKFIFIA